MNKVENEGSNAFPETAEEFWADKPADVTPWGWLFHPLNPFRFVVGIVAKLLNKIRYYSANRKGFTYFFQRTIAGWLGITEQWLREILRRLKVIGVIIDRKVGRNRQYCLIPFVLAADQPADRRSHQADQASSCGESFGISEQKKPANAENTMASSQASAPYMLHNVKLTNTEGSIIMPDDSKPAGNEPDPIVKAFEQTTGSKYQPKRDNQACARLQQFPLLVVIAGIMMSQLRVPNTKINSLAYCIPAVQEVAAACNTKIDNSIGATTKQHTLSEGGLMDYVRLLRKKLTKLRQ